LEFAEQNHVFDGVIAASDDLGLYKQEQGVELFYGAHVTPGTFEFFGRPALYGRVLQPEDYQPGAPPVFVMRHNAERDGANPNRNHAVALCLELIPETPVRGVSTSFAGFPSKTVLLPQLPSATYRGVDAPAPPL
jgi:hypothetical protein